VVRVERNIAPLKGPVVPAVYAAEPINTTGDAFNGAISRPLRRRRLVEAAPMVDLVAVAVEQVRGDPTPFETLPGLRA